MTLAACAHAYRRESGVVAPPSAPPPDRALIVFVQPEAWPAAIYRVTDTSQELVGILTEKTRIAYTVPPGDYLFMIVIAVAGTGVSGENADFMDAHLAGGQTYYAYAIERLGVWRGRMSLFAAHNDGSETAVTSKKFRKWLDSSEWVPLGDAARRWDSENSDYVNRRRVDFLKKWNARGEENKERQTLNREDGVGPDPTMARPAAGPSAPPPAAAMPDKGKAALTDDELYKKLRALKKAYDEGVLTKEEYEAKRAAALRESQ